MFIFLQFFTTCLGTLLIGCVCDMKSFDVIGIEDIVSLCFYVFASPTVCTWEIGQADCMC